MYSKHQAMQSWMVLPLINPYWLSCRSWIIICCSLSARIFVSNLMLQLRREIGLKSLTVSGLFILGIRVMKETLMLSRLTIQSKKLLAKLVEI